MSDHQSSSGVRVSDEKLGAAFQLVAPSNANAETRIETSRSQLPLSYFVDKDQRTREMQLSP